MRLYIFSGAYCFFEIARGPASILWMNTLKELLQRRYPGLILSETKQVPVLLGGMDHLSCGTIACPGTRAA